MTIVCRRPVDYLIRHSDRGIHHASESFQDLLVANKIICSMSRKGNCRANVCAENFFGRLKNEWTKDKIYESFEEVKNDIFNYIEVFYNRKRTGLCRSGGIWKCMK
jgi:putative transposase